MSRPLVAALVLATWATTALAAGNAGTRVIKKATHTNAQQLIVSGDSPWKNPDACDRSDQIVLASNQLKSAGVYREMLAMILSAHVSDRQIAAKVNGCVTINGKTYPKITQVTLY